MGVSCWATEMEPFQTATSYDAGGIFAPGLTVLDVNGDGEPDLIMTGFCAPNSVGCVTTGANLYAILGNGNELQPGEILYMLGDYGGREALLVGDLNDDGKPDLVLVHGCELLCPLDDVEVGVMLNNSGAPATTIALTSDKNPVSLFATVTYTATVAGGSGGTIDGTVTFADGDAQVATATMSTNRATYSTTYKKAGSHLMRATYSGVLHTAEGSRSVALTQNVVDPTKTVLATSGSPSFVGQPVTFSAAVTSAYGVIPSGELVKFYDQNTLLASVALSGGKATYTTSKLTAKKHGMQAIYAGDSMFATKYRIPRAGCGALLDDDDDHLQSESFEFRTEGHHHGGGKVLRAGDPDRPSHLQGRNNLDRRGFFEWRRRDHVQVESRCGNSPDHSDL